MMLSRGSKVIMKNGETLTVKSLEFNEFVPEERAEYVPKRDIKEVVGGKRPYAQPDAGRKNVYMDKDTLKRLQEIGDGNVSAGIRIAAKAYKG